LGWSVVNEVETGTDLGDDDQGQIRDWPVTNPDELDIWDDNIKLNSAIRPVRLYVLIERDSQRGCMGQSMDIKASRA
jgi:hypothetical protein